MTNRLVNFVKVLATAFYDEKWAGVPAFDFTSTASVLSNDRA